MSNGLRGARKLSEAGTEQTIMDNNNKETISNMDAAINGIQSWQEQRKKQLFKFKRELLANENEIYNASTAVKKMDEGEGKNCSENNDSNIGDGDNNLEQSIFITSETTQIGENSLNSNQSATTSITAYMKDENDDPIAFAVEEKLKQELAQLQAKRKTQLKILALKLMKNHLVWKMQMHVLDVIWLNMAYLQHN